MGYNPIGWTDHVTANPNRYFEVTNPDRSVTHSPNFGMVFQPGTPMCAATLGSMDAGIAHIHAAFNLYMSITQAQARAMDDRIRALET